MFASFAWSPWLVDEITTFTLACGHRLHDESCTARIRQHHNELLLAGGPPCPLCRSPMPVNPKDKTQAAMDAYTCVFLSKYARGCRESGTVPRTVPAVDAHRYRQILRECVAVTKEAADLGDVETLCNLGVYYVDGIGGERDPERKGIRNLSVGRAAAEMGLAVAQSTSRTCSLEVWARSRTTRKLLIFGPWRETKERRTQCTMPWHSSKDLVKAGEWFRRAAALGHKRAAEELRTKTKTKPGRACGTAPRCGIVGLE